MNYILSNKHFDLKIKDGVIASFRNAKDRFHTEFILPGEGFGRVLFRSGDCETILGNSGGQKFDVTGDYLSQSCVSTEDFGDYSFTNSFILEGDRFYHKIKVTNRTNTDIKISDMAVLFPCNTNFDWGCNASEKVIGHIFTAGHGSYIFWNRCDNYAPYLLMLPQNETKLCINGMVKRTVNSEEKEVPAVYLFGESLLDKAANWRQPVDSLILKPDSSKEFSFVYLWCSSFDEMKEKLVEFGSVWLETTPSYTLEAGKESLIAVSSRYDNVTLSIECNDMNFLEFSHKKGRTVYYKAIFNKLGENKIVINYGDKRCSQIEYFITEDIKTLIEKRAAFIVSHQIRDKTKWYDGLFAEHNNKTGALLSPDNYDNIKGWRIYEVSCDDPGLSKPAFLSGKLAEYPVQSEVEALDYYLENFVWGGLQNKDDNEFPYGIYGIPDWHKNRFSENKDTKGTLHIWRIYDYPHIALTWFNMYRVARDYPEIKTALDAKTYLFRAYHTALAMFQIPEELDEWSAYKTGLYNELVIRDIVKELFSIGEDEKANRLNRYWIRKIRFFVTESKDIFGSEYPFDTTGFESTHVFASEAFGLAVQHEKENMWVRQIDISQASHFMENQNACNIACRGSVEPAYYLYGSDYRGTNLYYTLSYMSQMGGCSVLDYALYYADDPFQCLRLGYGSLLSSWALMNTGTRKSNYGYWFPGKEHDGAASGGFEPLPFGKTWLDQPQSRGAWCYSCEIDLGFCGALRGAATILCDDPIFSLNCMGGSFEETAAGYVIISSDGVSRRFHYVDKSNRIHLVIDKGHFRSPISLSKDLSELSVTLDCAGMTGSLVHISGTEGYDLEVRNAEKLDQTSIKVNGRNPTIFLKRRDETL